MKEVYDFVTNWLILDLNYDQCVCVWESFPGSLWVCLFLVTEQLGWVNFYTTALPTRWNKSSFHDIFALLAKWNMSICL